MIGIWRWGAAARQPRIRSKPLPSGSIKDQVRAVGEHAGLGGVFRRDDREAVATQHVSQGLQNRWLVLYE
jgi:hypothetical protein